MVWQNGVQQLHTREDLSPAFFRQAQSKAHTRRFPSLFPQRSLALFRDVPVPRQAPSLSPVRMTGFSPLSKRGAAFSLDGPQVSRRGGQRALRGIKSWLE